MGVRLNKVLSELNIGLQTAVDFLKNNKALGELKDEMTPNTKISDEQYQALVDEFSGDKAVKTQADKIFTKKVKEKKVEKPVKVVEKKITQTEELLEQRSQFKPLGKIDLDNIGKKSPVKTNMKLHQRLLPKVLLLNLRLRKRMSWIMKHLLWKHQLLTSRSLKKNRKPLKQLMTQRLPHLV